MAFEDIWHTSPLSEAVEDLSSYKWHFVKFNTSGQARLLDTATEVPDGVLQDASSEQYWGAGVAVDGFTKVVASEALAIGDYVKPEFVSTSDCGKAQKCSPADPNCCGKVFGAAAAEDELATIRLINAPLANPYSVQPGAAVTDATAGASTYTAAQLLAGLILRDPAGGNRSDVSPTALLIIAAMGQDVNTGDHFEFTIRNTADAAETITLTGGTDVTISGTATIAQNYSKTFRVEVTSATTVTIYSLGTFVH